MQLNTKALSPKGLAKFSVLTFMPSDSQTFWVLLWMEYQMYRERYRHTTASKNWLLKINSVSVSVWRRSGSWRHLFISDIIIIQLLVRMPATVWCGVSLVRTCTRLRGLWGEAKTLTFPQSQLGLGCGEPPCRLAALCREFRQFVVFNCNCEYSSRIVFECWKLSFILVLSVLPPVSTQNLYLLSR